MAKERERGSRVGEGEEADEGQATSLFRSEIKLTN